MTDSIECPLCNASKYKHHHRDERRDYYLCAECHLVFVPGSQRLTIDEEKAVYDLHENHPDDSGYRKFLSRIFTAVCERVKPPAFGMDFGAGPGPTLSLMFAEAGYGMAIYDPVYASDESVLTAEYNFITATEVFEHLFFPGKEIEKLISILKPGGWLAVMTGRIPSECQFSDWHYIRDPTHVCFYTEKTFHWIASRYNLRLNYSDNNVYLLQKK